MSFIVLEGLDGAGKSTQVRMLQEHFEMQGKQTQFLHFPRTDDSIFGDLIAKFLRGDLGAVDSVDPYLVALIYACDRNDAKGTIKKWLDDGIVVIADRYVSSNIAFQCAKIKDLEQRRILRDWIINLEFEYYQLPKPSINLFLDVPFSFTKKKLTEQREGDDRDYLQGKSDIHENDLTLQERVREVYLWQCTIDSNIHRIECESESGQMLSPESINKKVIEVVNNHI
jgi:dTMP kinase